MTDTSIATSAVPLRIADATGALAAEFIPGLGMIGVSLKHDGEELLGEARGLQAYTDELKTFALPLLYPWANRLSAWRYTALGKEVALDRAAPFIPIENGLPIHGLLNACPDWRVATHSADALVAELDFLPTAPYFASFPFPHRLTYAVRVDPTGDGALSLSVSTTVTPTADSPVPISFGFHPYLTLPGSDRRTWQLELPVAVRAVVDADSHIPTGEMEVLAPGVLDGALGDRTFDDSFPELRPQTGKGATFSLADARRRISVEHRSGYPVAQVFTPEAADFICFEPMTAPVDALSTGERLPVARPGAQFSAEFAITVTRL
jgi:galactose mutarotase-like enzyme